MQIQTNDLPSVVVFAHRALLRHRDMNTPSITREPTGPEVPRPSFIASRLGP
jgi:hypothetical protein